jgi:hypothetical protein
MLLLLLLLLLLFLLLLFLLFVAICCSGIRMVCQQAANLHNAADKLRAEQQPSNARCEAWLFGQIFGCASLCTVVVVVVV